MKRTILLSCVFSLFLATSATAVLVPPAQTSTPRYENIGIGMAPDLANDKKIKITHSPTVPESSMIFGTMLCTPTGEDGVQYGGIDMVVFPYNSAEDITGSLFAISGNAGLWQNYDYTGEITGGINAIDARIVIGGNAAEVDAYTCGWVALFKGAWTWAGGYGTVTNAYGLYLPDVETGKPANITLGAYHSIYSKGGDSVHDGSFTFGDYQTEPTETVTVIGDGSITKDLHVKGENTLGNGGVHTSILGESTVTVSASTPTYIEGVSGKALVKKEAGAYNIYFANGLHGTAGISATASPYYTGTLSWVAGVRSTLTFQANSGSPPTVSEAAGFWMGAPSVSNVDVENLYGLRLPAITAGSALNYAIYSAGGQSVHAGNFRIGDTTAPTYELEVAGTFALLEKSADPAEPAEGEAIIWMSDGTGKGDDGDVLIASKAGGTTKWTTLFDHSAGAAW